ncbi:MAG: transglycosylase domain-containing protein [Myxococcota bacterium]
MMHRGRELALALAAAAAAVGPCCAVLLGWAVWLAPAPELSREHVASVVAQESVVTYRDGTTRLGGFTDGAHRRTLAFEQLPPAWIVSIVASEDARFWRHRGVDPRGLLQALRDDLLAGAVVAGGSTLTQQTAKNLFGRQGRALGPKLGEVLDALRLEARYDKAEILSLYANQFHVAGNGRGLAIAARHLFDEEVDELDLAQCAFVAGMVKAPSHLDPFFGGDEAWRHAATERAVARTEHVLRRIVAEPAAQLAGPLPVGEVEALQAEAAALLERGVTLPFRRGAFRWDDSAALDEVARRLRAPPFDRILRDAGIDAPQQTGIVVVTTLDSDAQREATYGLWHHLSEVGTELEALTAADLPTGRSAPRYDPDRPVERHGFREARVAEHVVRDRRAELVLDLGGRRCRVDRAGVVRMAVATARGAAGNTWQKLSGDAVDAWAASVPDGAVVVASVREIGRDGEPVCDLELRPELQGAVVVVQEGELRAMVGGNDDRNFNRARAHRQLGSTFKPLVYHAALTLGWSPTDRLDNRRIVVPFDGTWYTPDPDHEPAAEVSMAWAGVRSENLGSVWLLQHLFDPVEDARVAALAAQFGLAPMEGEAPKAWRKRLGALGVRPADAAAEVRFDRARREVLRALPRSPHPRTPSGCGPRRRRGLRRRAGAGERLGAPAAGPRQRLDVAVVADRRLPRGDGGAVRRAAAPAGSGARGRSACSRSAATPTSPGACCSPAAPHPPASVGGPAAPRCVRAAAALARPGQRAGALRRPAVPAVLRRASRRPAAPVDGVHARGGAPRRGGCGPADAELGPDALLRTSALRGRLATRYVAALARAYGVQSEIREVPSLPLGVSEITLEEAAVLYDGLVTGRSWAGGDVAEPARLIRQIRTADGRVLYDAQTAAEAVAEPAVAAMTADILRNVVLHGTGARARDAVRHGGHAVPVGGKTGTTNAFRNAAFSSFVPVARPDGYVVAGSYAVAAYVG